MIANTHDDLTTQGCAKSKVDYLIVGNSAAAIAAVEKIRASDRQGSITMISPEPYAAYGRPLISYLIEGKTDDAHMAYRPSDFYKLSRIETRFGSGCAAVSLDAAKHQVQLENGETIEYGKVLFSTGSVPFVPPIKGIEGRNNVYAFLSLDDARGVQNEALAATAAAHVKGRSSRAIVIGAGLIGLKAAEALLPHIDEVLVLEMAPRILPAVLDEEGASLLREQLADRGITCMPGITADELLGAGDRISGAHLTDGTEVACDMVVAAVGVRPNSAILDTAGAKSERGIVCDSSMRTSLADVYAAGDVTQTTDVLDGAKRPLALWPNAVAQGKVAGACMADAPDAPAFDGAFAVNAVDFFDISLLTSGVINPAPDGGYTVKTFCDSVSYTKLVMRDDKLFGYILLNGPDNAGIYTALINDGTPLSSLADDFFAQDPSNIGFSQQARWDRLHRFYPADLNRLGVKERA